eukprot:CAMPEP_0204254976 /NCGR_PEP_ID=MMETSP0468-20130131/2915_1 /ASSEMBLY_ACC=CAM_ASM_000383 /TAXON_ID=2969 /ORGANISM="Oxyrrhis marina" /LENGTH=266 /DNA_ID=CAMNT_0051228799 /DNA_START=49 /DNA_END=849 /DNA_ORIENTATION=+
MALQISIKNTFVNVDEKDPEVSSSGHRRIQSWGGCSSPSSWESTDFGEVSTCSSMSTPSSSPLADPVPCAEPHVAPGCWVPVWTPWSPCGDGFVDGVMPNQAALHMAELAAMAAAGRAAEAELMAMTGSLQQPEPPAFAQGYAARSDGPVAQRAETNGEEWAAPRKISSDESSEEHDKRRTRVPPTMQELEDFIQEFDLDHKAAEMLLSHRSTQVQSEVMEWMRKRVAGDRARKAIRNFSAVFVKRMVQADRDTVAARQGRRAHRA